MKCQLNYIIVQSNEPVNEYIQMIKEIQTTKGLAKENKLRGEVNGRQTYNPPIIVYDRRFVNTCNDRPGNVKEEEPPNNTVRQVADMDV